MLGANGIRAIFRTYDEHPIGVARCVAVDEFLKSKSCTKCGKLLTTDKCSVCNVPTQQFDYIYFWDSDNVPNPNIVNRLLSYDEPVVSGWYLSRSTVSGGLPVILKITDKKLPKKMEDILKEQAMSYYYGVKNENQPWTVTGFPTWEAMRLSEFMTLKLDKKGLRTVDGVGAGALLIKREVFPHLERPYFLEDYLFNRSFGEDLWFSLNCKIHGIPIKVDPQSFVGHFAFGVIDSRHLKQFLRNEITKDQTQKIFKQK